MLPLRDSRTELFEEMALDGVEPDIDDSPGDDATIGKKARSKDSGLQLKSLDSLSGQSDLQAATESHIAALLRERGERKAAAIFIQRVVRGHFGRLVRERWKKIARRHARVLLKFRRARQERRRTMVDRKLSAFKAGSYEIPKQKGVEL